MPVFDFDMNGSLPKVDVKEEKEAYVMHMDLPGMNENEVNVELEHNVLTVSSHHEESSAESSDKKERDKYLIRERRVSTFTRSFTLPEDINAEEVAASFKNGVLTVRIPRKAVAAPKRIAISAA